MVSSVKKNTNYKIIMYHVLGWLIYFITQHWILTSYHVKPNLLFQSGVWFLSIFVFYLNYFYLIPSFLFKNKTFFYAASVIIMLTGVYFANQQWTDRFRPKPPKTIVENNIDNKQQEKEKEWEQRKFHHYKRKVNIMSIYGFLFFFALSLAARMIQKWNENEKLKEEQKQEKVNAELAFLKKQVNPHFLFNSLNSIYSLANKQSSQTVEAILKLSQLLRYMLYETDNNTVYLNNEVEHIENYIALQKYRLNDKTKIELNINGDTKNYLIEPLLLIALVENAFKYGADNVHDSIIKIDIKAHEANLHFEVANTIVQEAKELNGDKSGIGLTNIKRRLHLLYPNIHSLDISKEDNTFKVMLSLKLKK